MRVWREAVGRLKVLNILKRMERFGNRWAWVPLGNITHCWPYTTLQTSTAKRIATCRFSLFSKIQVSKGYSCIKYICTFNHKKKTAACFIFFFGFLGHPKSRILVGWCRQNHRTGGSGKSRWFSTLIIAKRVGCHGLTVWLRPVRSICGENKWDLLNQKIILGRSCRPFLGRYDNCCPQVVCVFLLIPL